MQQFEVPIKVPVDPDANTTDLLVDRVAKTPDSALFSIPTGDGQWEDITVLTACLTLPQTKGESRREKRFDRYYRALADAYFARCEQKLLPDAAKTCRAAMARSAPWQMTAVTLTYRVSAQTEDAVVFTFEVNDGEGVLRRWEEGWECSAFLPLFKAERGSALAT